MKKIFILIFLFFAVSYSLFAQDLYEERLNKGLRNADDVSYYLIEKAHNDPANIQEYLAEAVKLSPDLPAVYFHLAWVSLTTSPANLYESAHYLLGGFHAYKKNFWWIFNLTGIAYLGFLLTLVCSVLFAVLVRLSLDVPLLTHEIREDGKSFFILLLAFFISALGPLYFIAAMLMILSFYFKKGDRLLTYVFLGALVFLPLFLKPVNVFLSAGTSPELKAIVAVNEGEDNAYALYALRGKEGRDELFSLALAQKREGRYNEAIENYRKILDRHPDDAAAYNNLGNCYAILKSYDEAKGAYEKSLKIRPLASANYNMSQVSREMLDFEAGDRYFDEAKRIDSDAVAGYRQGSSAEPNRLYADELLGMADFWRYALGVPGEHVISLTYLPLWSTPVIGLVVLVSFVIFSRKRKVRAFSCKRCGVVICARCERSLKWGSMCNDCFSALVTLEKDPRDRIAKVMTVYDAKRRKKNIIRFLSFVMPGLHLVYTGKIVKGTVLMFLFLLFPVVFLLSIAYQYSIYPYAHSWLAFALVVSVPTLYFMNIIATRRFLKEWV
ncbi:MAG: tetratricopeptide repeat protein [bacterium]